MDAALSLFEFNAVRAVLLREFRAALINRYFQIFAALSLLGGLAAAFFSENPNAVAFFVVQMALYLISLFALLAGVSSAQGERSEWQLMFAQPVPRASYPLAKFIAYLSIFALVIGVSAWLFLLVVVDLLGLLAARLEFVQKLPDLWVSLLMLNPLDAFRIDAL